MLESHLEDNVIATAEESRKAIRLLLLFSVIGFLLIDRVSRVPDQLLLSESLDLLEEFSMIEEPGDWAPQFAISAAREAPSELTKEHLRVVRYESEKCRDSVEQALATFVQGTTVSPSFNGCIDVKFDRLILEPDHSTVGDVVAPLESNEKSYVTCAVPDLKGVADRLSTEYPTTEKLSVEFLQVGPIVHDHPNYGTLDTGRDQGVPTDDEVANEFFYAVAVKVDGKQKSTLKGFLPAIFEVDMSADQFVEMVTDGYQEDITGGDAPIMSALNVARAVENLRPFMDEIEGKTLEQAKSVLEGREPKEWSVSLAGFTFQGGAAAMALVLGYAVLFSNLVVLIMSLKRTDVSVRKASLTGFPWIEAGGWAGTFVFFLTNVLLPAAILYQINKYAWDLASFHAKALPMSMPGSTFTTLLFVVSAYTFLISLVCVMNVHKLIPMRTTSTQ